jgi:hypothetical protein
MSYVSRFLCAILLLIVATRSLADQPAAALTSDQSVHRLLYVGTPGIQNDMTLGGQGVLVFDMDRSHQFVKRIDSPAGKEKPENIKGICASAATHRLYETTPAKLYCLDLVSEQPLWEKALPKGCDRMSITPDGKTLYVPAFEKDIWNVVDALSGEIAATIDFNSGSHNTVGSFDGQRMYLAGLRSPTLSIADTKTHEITRTVGPFASAIRPFTINSDETRCYVNVNGLLGFEIGDLTTGKKLAHVEVTGFEKGSVKRHGCPSHGIGLTPDEKELWLCDSHNQQVHIFDLTADPPKQLQSIALRDQPGWVTFSLDGHYAYPSTGEIIDTKTKQIVTALADEMGRPVHSEKMLEIHFQNGQPIRVGDQFGLGRVHVATSTSP